MATFLTFPVEIHVSIAQHCEDSDLVNLCCTSKLLNERCLRVLYRHVNLVRDQPMFGSRRPLEDWLVRLDSTRSEVLFVYTLLSRPEYGRHIRSFKGALSFIKFMRSHISEKQLWRAMKSLTRVERVDIGTADWEEHSTFFDGPKHIPTDSFQSATSVTLVGHMDYGLAKSILNAINPATLQHLCLDMVRDRLPCIEYRYRPGDRGEDGRIVARGAMSNLLTSLTGHCLALRTLTLGRIGQGKSSSDFYRDWHAAAEEASYVEWAVFIRSVRGTVEKIVFEQAEKSSKDTKFDKEDLSFRIMDERFGKLVFPTLVSGVWPCLTVMELRGVRGSNDQGGTAGLAMELMVVHSVTTWIEVQGIPHHCLGL